MQTKGGGGKDWWNHPAGWVLVGVVSLYLLQERALFPSPLLACNSAILALLTCGLCFLFRHHRIAVQRLRMMICGVLLGCLSLILNQPIHWPASWPPREFDGWIRITSITKSNTNNSVVMGLGTLQCQDQPLWQSLHNAKVYFSLEPLESTDIYVAGQTVRARGVLRPINKDNHATGFQEYLSRQNIHLRLVQGFIHSPDSTWYTQARIQGEQQLRMALQSGTEHRPREQSAYLGMLLGSRSYLNPEDTDLFIRSGTMHLFAISGLHIGIISAGILAILQVSRTPSILRPIFGIALTGLYVWVTGSAPSAVRAWVMISVYWGGYGLLRKPDSFRSLCTSALIYLLMFPEQINHPGFQLSYSVVAVILLWGIPMLRRMPMEMLVGSHYPYFTLSRQQQVLRGVMRAFWATIIISLSATLGSAPWILAYFEIITPGGILINLPASLIATGVLFAALPGMVGFLIGLEWIATFFNQAALLLLALFLHWIEWWSTIPGVSIHATRPPTTAEAGLLMLSGILLLLIGRRPLSRMQGITACVFPFWIGLGILFFTDFA